MKLREQKLYIIYIFVLISKAQYSVAATLLTYIYIHIYSQSFHLIEVSVHRDRSIENKEEFLFRDFLIIYHVTYLHIYLYSDTIDK